METNLSVIETSQQNKNGNLKKDVFNESFKQMTDAMTNLNEIYNKLILRFIDWKTRKEETIELSKYLENHYNSDKTF